MKKILLSTLIIVFGYGFGYSQTNIVGLDTISDPHMYYFMNNLNNLIVGEDSTINEFKDMFYKEGNLCFVGSDDISPRCSETIESMTETISKKIGRLTKEGNITFRVMDIDIYYNTVKKRYSGIYDVILSNEKMGLSDKISIVFGINSSTTFQARSIIYWFDHYNDFHPITVIELDGSTTDKSNYSVLE